MYVYHSPPLEPLTTNDPGNAVVLLIIVTLLHIGLVAGYLTTCSVITHGCQFLLYRLIPSIAGCRWEQRSQLP